MGVRGAASARLERHPGSAPPPSARAPPLLPPPTPHCPLRGAQRPLIPGRTRNPPAPLESGADRSPGRMRTPECPLASVPDLPSTGGCERRRETRPGAGQSRVWVPRGAVPLDGARGTVATGRARRAASCSALDRDSPAAQVASPAAQGSPLLPPPPQKLPGRDRGTSSIPALDRQAAVPDAAQGLRRLFPRVSGCHPQPSIPRCPQGLSISRARGAARPRDTHRPRRAGLRPHWAPGPDPWTCCFPRSPLNCWA